MMYSLSNDNLVTLREILLLSPDTDVKAPSDKFRINEKVPNLIPLKNPPGPRENPRIFSVCEISWKFPVTLER